MKIFLLDSEFIDKTSFCIDDIFNYRYYQKDKKILKLQNILEIKKDLLYYYLYQKNTIRYQILEGSVNSKIYLKFISYNKEDFKI